MDFFDNLYIHASQVVCLSALSYFSALAILDEKSMLVYKCYLKHVWFVSTVLKVCVWFGWCMTTSFLYNVVLSCAYPYIMGVFGPKALQVFSIRYPHVGRLRCVSLTEQADHHYHQPYNKQHHRHNMTQHSVVRSSAHLYKVLDIYIIYG